MFETSYYSSRLDPRHDTQEGRHSKAHIIVARRGGERETQRGAGGGRRRRQTGSNQAQAAMTYHQHSPFAKRWVRGVKRLRFAVIGFWALVVVLGLVFGLK